jgi:hypothetical protein
MSYSGTYHVTQVLWYTIENVSHLLGPVLLKLTKIALATSELHSIEMRQLSSLYKTMLAVPKSHPIHLQLKRPTHPVTTHHLNTIQLEHSPPLEKNPALIHDPPLQRPHSTTRQQYRLPLRRCLRNL